MEIAYEDPTGYLDKLSFEGASLSRLPVSLVALNFTDSPRVPNRSLSYLFRIRCLPLDALRIEDIRFGVMTFPLRGVIGGCVIRCRRFVASSIIATVFIESAPESRLHEHLALN